MSRSDTEEPLNLESTFPGFDQLETSAVVVDEANLISNIKEMAALVGTGAALHPHIKTHKCLEIARLQQRYGAEGYTCAKVYEALMLLEAGLSPVTVAYPLVEPSEATRLLVIAKKSEQIRFICDNPVSVKALSEATKYTGKVAQVFIKVDVGLHRCGVSPNSTAALTLAKLIADDPNLRFMGLLSHAGHAYGGGNPEGIRKIAAEERQLMLGVRDNLQAAGYAVPLISIGSTPSLLANDGFEGIDEVRPGNYVFYDMTAVRLGLVSRNQLSLGVAARVVSANDRYAIVNVGSKTLSSDLGAHGTGAGAGFGEAWIKGQDTPLTVAKLSEEHGFLEHNGEAPEIGSHVLILPNHSCPVANLSGSLTFLKRGTAPRAVPVDSTSLARH